MLRILFLAAVIAAPALAAAQQLKLNTQVFQEEAVAAADGKSLLKRVPAAKAVPGSEVIYVIAYQNTGTQPADGVVISNPVPEGLSYRSSETAVQGARFEVSVDGAGSYGVLTSLKAKAADGSERPAQIADVTHVRWTFERPVAGGESGDVSYRALIK